jgi:hypothetical protein
MELVKDPQMKTSDRVLKTARSLLVTHSQRFIMGLVCLGLMMILGSCHFPFKPSATRSGVSPVEFKKYLDAVYVYDARNYEKSANQFEAIREQTANPEMSRMALYGLACSRLMSADSPQEYQQALSLWDTWVKCAPRQGSSENPVLFAPVIKEKMIFSQIPLDAEGAIDTHDQTAPAWLLVRADQQLQRMKKQLEEASKCIDSRDKKIKALEKEISRLNEQINAFEKIDQKIQTKKNAIPSAD